MENSASKTDSTSSWPDSHQSSNHKRIRKIVANRWQPPSSENCWHVGFGWHATLWTNVWNMNIIAILWNWLPCDMLVNRWDMEIFRQNNNYSLIAAASKVMTRTSGKKKMRFHFLHFLQDKTIAAPIQTLLMVSTSETSDNPSKHLHPSFPLLKERHSLICRHGIISCAQNLD